MTPINGRALSGIIITGALLAGTALAATPESGSVSKTAPKVTWKGETTGGYLTRMPTAVSGSTDTPCEAPSCDTFTLNVADSANLTVAETLGSDSETAAFTMRITKPDGSVVQTDSDPGAASGGKYVKVVIKNAPTGDYTTHHYDNAAATMTYEAYGELTVAAAPAPAPPAGTTPPPSGGGQTPPPAGTVEAINLSVKVGKASARKLAKTRKLAAKVTVSRAVTSVTAALKSGKKVVGKGSLAATNGTATLNVRLSKKKLKKGKYTLTVVATDGKTTTTKTINVKVGK